MSKRSQEKRRARAREKAKEARREQTRGPWSRLTGDENHIECWMQCVEGFDRVIQLYALRPVYGGGFVLGYFVIDFDCLGIKDALARTDVSPGAFLERCRKDSRELGGRFFKTDLAQMRQIVAGAVRWANEQGFVLPRHMDRCLEILGISDVTNADISRFGAPSGGLHYVGFEEDLAARLGGVPVDEFLAREDVDATFLNDDFQRDGFEQDDLEERDADEEVPLAELKDRLMEPMAQASAQLASDAESWYRKAGREPPELLQAAAALHLTVRFDGEKFCPEIDETTVQAVQERAEREIVRTARSPVQQDQLRRAHQVIGDYFATLPDDERRQAGRSTAAMSARLREWDKKHMQDLVRAAEPVTCNYQRSMKEELTRWCFANGQPVHERIDDAIKFFLTAIFLGPAQERNDAAADLAFKETASALLALESQASWVGMREALSQLEAFMTSLGSGPAFVKALRAHLPDHDRERDWHTAPEGQ